VTSEMRRRLHDLTRLVSDWVWETNADFELTDVSDRIVDLIGYHPFELLGKDLRSLGVFLSANDQPFAVNWRSPFRDVMFEMADGKGAVHKFLISSLPKYDAKSGEFEGVRGIAKDVTELRRAENAIRESEERHRQFAADVAHELRTPLAVMRSNLDSLDEAEVAESLRADVDTMSRMVEQLLAAARLEFLEIGSAEQTDLREICMSVASHLAPLFINQERSIEVIGHEPILIQGNAHALEQAVRNLVENALRFSPQGSTVTVEVGPDATIGVIDRGPGVPAENRVKIFRRFVRSDRKVGGTGLGLSIVQRTVDAHGGEIDVDDTPGGGATFIMRFPALDSGNA
jgi:signal transduction histidine kinase